MTTENKNALVLNTKQEKALISLSATLAELTQVYTSQFRLEDQVLAELIMFFAKFPKVAAKSTEARELNKRVGELIKSACPNMPLGTRKLYIKIAKDPNTWATLNVKPGTTSVKTVLDNFKGLKDNKPDPKTGKAPCTFAGYFRKKGKGKGKAKAKATAITIVTLSPAAIAAADVALDAIKDALAANGCKINNESDIIKIIAEIVELNLQAAA